MPMGQRSGKKTNLRRLKNRQLPKIIEIPFQDKRIDDDLPKIGQAFQHFLRTWQVE
jgi:hypothetical protein